MKQGAFVQRGQFCVVSTHYVNFGKMPEMPLFNNARFMVEITDFIC